MSRLAELERITVPHALIALALKRTGALVKAAVHEPNIIREIAVSCYVQGLTDGYDSAARNTGDPHGE